MSRGLSWRQKYMLRDIAERCRQRNNMRSGDGPWPVAWLSIDYGDTHTEEYDCFTARGRWNLEQATRRALRSLERRGLVFLDRYVFRPEPIITNGNGWGSPEIVWNYVDPDDHIPGESRIMTGVMLTDAGEAAVAVLERQLDRVQE